MGDLQIGANILRLRKEKGITQEEFAEYLGVSKPAVSKWESGQSYPDIFLLPVIASYFNKSVDELMGYQPQMTEENIKKTYLRLADAFAKEPFESVLQQSGETVKKYYSCWKLLFAIGELFVNHAPQAGSPEKAAAVYEEASALFERVEKESRDAALAHSSLAMRAYCDLVLQRPAEAIDLLDGSTDLLGGSEESKVSAELLLVKAYAMKGDKDRAKDVLQKYLYQGVLALFGAFPDFMALYADEQEKLDDCLHRALGFIKIFGLENLHPASCFTFYLTAAALYASKGKSGQALDLLETYVALLTREGVFPLRLKGDGFFDRLEPYFASLNLGTDTPRSDILIRKDMETAVSQNPAFRSLRDDERFQRVLRRLARWEEESSCR